MNEWQGRPSKGFSRYKPSFLIHCAPRAVCFLQGSRKKEKRERDRNKSKTGQERKKRWNVKQWRKEMKRTLLLSFFSCLTQLSDFAFKFKTEDQTARGTLYFCQETIWYLSVTLLRARNREPFLSAGPAYGVMCKKKKSAKIHEWLHSRRMSRIYGSLSVKEKARHNLIITFHK